MAQTKWYQLDNAAKIVPSTAGGSDTRVFRITCELNEEVNPEALQSAVTAAARDFPHFSSVLKKGLFWYYLDQSDLDAEVTRDDRPALDTIYWEGRRNLLYRVNYHGRRINLEMYHVLTDGTGAFEFLKAILAEYLGIRYGSPRGRRPRLSGPITCAAIRTRTCRTTCLRGRCLWRRSWRPQGSATRQLLKQPGSENRQWPS